MQYGAAPRALLIKDAVAAWTTSTPGCTIKGLAVTFSLSVCFAPPRIGFMNADDRIAIVSIAGGCLLADESLLVKKEKKESMKKEEEDDTLVGVYRCLWFGRYAPSVRPLFSFFSRSSSPSIGNCFCSCLGTTAVYKLNAPSASSFLASNPRGMMRDSVPTIVQRFFFFLPLDMDLNIFQTYIFYIVNTL